MFKKFFQNIKNISEIKNFSNIPNLLTFFRIFSIIPIVVLLYYDNRVLNLIAGILFAIAFITDFFDGYIARKYNLITNFGKFIDPLADKLLVLAVFIMLVHLNRVSPWIAIVILSREFSITGLRAIAASEGVIMQASNLGKSKTGYQIAALIPLIIYYPFIGLNLKAIGYFFLYISLVVTVWSGYKYIKDFLKDVSD
jgi:CDP-diacylglycerol--glycerol-3-phosphate 3-phosphatidyltransferase